MCNTQDIFDTKKAFLLLLALSGFVACKQESPQEPKPTPTPTGESQLATGPTTTVTLNLEGELDPEEAKALRLHEGSPGKFQVRWAEGEKVDAVWVIYDDRATFLQGQIQGVIKNGKFTFYGDIPLATEYIDPQNADKIYLSVHIGNFTPKGSGANLRYHLNTQKLVAPYYEAHAGGYELYNDYGRFPVPFKSNLMLLRRVDKKNKLVGKGRRIDDVKSIQHLDLKFSLAGNIVKAKVINNSGQTLTISQFHVHGFGARNTFLRPPSRDGKRPTLIGDALEAGPRTIPVNVTWNDGPRPKDYAKLYHGNSNEYLIYIPADGSVPSESNYGRIEVTTDEEIQAQKKLFSFEGTNKKLINGAHNGKIIKTTIKINKAK
jgi:hypothetical protein